MCQETSKIFVVEVGLRFLLLLTVMNLISGEISEQEELKKIVYQATQQWQLMTSQNYRQHFKNGVTT